VVRQFGQFEDDIGPVPTIRAPILTSFSRGLVSVHAPDVVGDQLLGSRALGLAARVAAACWALVVGLSPSEMSFTYTSTLATGRAYHLEVLGDLRLGPVGRREDRPTAPGSSCVAHVSRATICSRFVRLGKDDGR
jgi:hypothetical protein